MTWLRILPFLLIICISFGNAQEPVFLAKTSGNKVSQNTVFSVQFELKNGATNAFEPPSFKGFKVVGGPSSSSSTMYVNGVVSKSQTWTYSILASEKGHQTIGSAKVDILGKVYKTKPIRVEVLEPSALARQGTPGEAKDPVFLRAELNDSVFYPGQQIVLTYKLLFKENVQTVNTLAEDDYADFFVQHFSNLNPLAEYEMINGEQYTSRVIKSLALYAHQSGTYEIDPLIMKAGIDAPFEANRGFFSMRRVHNVQVASPSVTIQVDPLPAHTPDSFSGAVGQYEMQVSYGTRPLTTNNAFAFTLEIVGNGDKRRWELPQPVADAEFDIYNPRVMKDEQFESDGEMKQRKTVMYQMLPKAAGIFKLHVPFTYFDPERKDFVTISSDTISRQVSQGTKRSQDLNDDSGLAETPQLMNVSGPLCKDAFWRSMPHLLLFGLMLSGAGFSIFRVWRYEKEREIPEAERIRQQAGIRAKEKLSQLEKELEQQPTSTFYETTTEIFYTFVTDRFSIPSSELDEAGLAKYLEVAEVDEPLANRVRTFFSQCLTVRYGGIPGGMSRAQMLEECRRIIHDLEA